MKVIERENIGIKPIEVTQKFDMCYESGQHMGFSEVKRITDKAVLLSVSDDKWTHSKELDLWIPISLITISFTYLEEAYEEYSHTRRVFQKVTIPEWYINKNKYWFKHC